MKRMIAQSIAALFCAATAVHAADIYLDMNGTTAGFGVDSTASPVDVNFTNLTWNTDSTGGAGGAITNVNDGDILHFGLEGTAGILFNWSYYTNATVGGIHTYQTAGSTAGINRFQKKGGGFQTINWAPGATFNTEKEASLWWDLGTFGDFEKIGNKWLIFSDGGVKLNGTCTISTNNVIVRNLGTVSSVSSFKLNGGELRFDDNLDDGGAVTANIGILSGSGAVNRDGAANALNNLTVQTTGANMTNNVATDLIKFSWGIAATLTSDATTSLEINKSGGTNYADKVSVDWGGETLTYGGDLNVTLLGGSETLVAGDEFDLFSDNTAGSFNTIKLPDLGDPGLIWSTSLLSASGIVSVVVADASAPSAPLNLVAVSNAYTVTLDWDDNPEPTVTGYKVYRSETSGSGFVEIGDTGASAFVDTTPIPNDITYYYRVTAYNFVPVEGDPSAEVSTTVLFGLRNGDFELPALVSGGTTISNSGDWAQNGENQAIQHSTWATESGDQGVWLKGYNQNVTNSFWQDVPAAEGLDYLLDAGIKVGEAFRTNGGQIDMSLVWLDAGSVEISRIPLDVLSAISTNGTFVHTNLTATAPAGTSMIRSEFYWTTTANATNDVPGDKSSMIDNVSITRSSTPSAYAAWSASYGLTKGEEGDDDGDLLVNLSEYALGGNPTNSANVGTTPVSTVVAEGGTNGFDYIYVRRTSADSGITYNLALTENLIFGPWATNTGFTVTGIGPDVDGFDTVTNTTSTVESQKFIKLLIEQN